MILRALNGTATSSAVLNTYRKTTADVTTQCAFLIHYVSLALCGNVRTSHIVKVCTLSISLTVVLSVFHDLFTHFSPRRTSIFNRGGSMFSHGLISDMVRMHNMQTHTVCECICEGVACSLITACILCCLFLWRKTNSASGVEPAASTVTNKFYAYFNSIYHIF